MTAEDSVLLLLRRNDICSQNYFKQTYCCLTSINIIGNPGVIALGFLQLHELWNSIATFG